MRTSAPQPDSTKPARLPVNPRRNHVEAGQRKRVKTACNSCNTRRVRCSGDVPCINCRNAHRECIYPPTDKKVSIAQSERDELRDSKAILEKCLLEAIPDPTVRENLMLKWRLAHHKATENTNPVKEEGTDPNSPTPSNSTTALSPSQETTYSAQYDLFNQPHRINGSIDAAATEGSLLQDRDGTKRWLGGTSGATFLDHLKKFMNTLKSSLGYNDNPGFTFLASRGQYQTSDSRLLSIPAGENIQTFAPQLSWNDAAISLAKVETLLQGSTTAPICGGIQYFGDFSPQRWAQAQSDPSRLREQAFYEAVFALGTVFSLTAANSRRDGHLGETFFAKARSILGDSNDISRYSIRDVSTLALMAMYMTEMNRRDNSYMYLSSAMTICCMFGGLNGRLSDERDVRMVWTLFCMTRDASYVMGRPPLYPDEAFQLPRPSEVPGLPTPDGLNAHIDLSRIAGYIVTETYQIAPRAEDDAFQDTVARINGAMKRLNTWRESLPPALQIPLDLPPEIQIPLGDTPMDKGLPMDRSLCMLHMKWNQLRILCLRPLFFVVVKASVGGDFVNLPFDPFNHEHYDLLQECSLAARRNLRLGRHIYDQCVSVDHKYNRQNEAGKLVMMDLHHIFNAVVILLLHQMVFSNVVNTDTMGILAAKRILENEAKTECASPGSKAGGSGVVAATGYASDCLGVLNDLAALVAQMRPVRFRGSEHVNTGVNIGGLGAPAPIQHSHEDLSSSGAAASGNNNGKGLDFAPSEEQLAANLGLENPYGPPQSWYDTENTMMQDAGTTGGTTGGEPYTNQKEMERWILECREGLSGPFLRYTGM